MSCQWLARTGEGDDGKGGTGIPEREKSHDGDDAGVEELHLGLTAAGTGAGGD